MLPIFMLGRGQYETFGKPFEDHAAGTGYKIEIYTDKVPNARAMDFAEDTTLFVGSMMEGKVYAVKPDRSVVVIDDSLEMPTGLDYYEGDLYVAAVSRILKYEDILKNLDKSPEPIVINGVIFLPIPGMAGNSSG